MSMWAVQNELGGLKQEKRTGLKFWGQWEVEVDMRNSGRSRHVTMMKIYMCKFLKILAKYIIKNSFVLPGPVACITNPRTQEMRAMNSWFKSNVGT